MHEVDYLRNLAKGMERHQLKEDIKEDIDMVETILDSIEKTKRVDEIKKKVEKIKEMARLKGLEP